MYDFKHQIHENQRFNTYELYREKDKPKISFYQKIRNSLFFVIIVIVLFIMGAFLLKSYQNYSDKNSLVITQEIGIEQTSLSQKENSANLALTQAITKSVVQNLQSQEKMERINYDELKLIIKKVVNKIQEEPVTTKYTKN